MGSLYLYLLTFKLRLHDTTGCQTGLTTGCMTGLTTDWMFVYTIQPVVQPVVKPVSQQVASCKRGFMQFYATTRNAMRRGQRAVNEKECSVISTEHRGL